MDSSPPPRPIRSFVLRQGRFSDAQNRAIENGMPRWGLPFQNSPLDLDTVFQRKAPKILEIGFGMGVATAEIAQSRPDTDFLAIEVHGPGVGNLLKLIEAEALSNIRIIRHDAVAVVEQMLVPESLDGFHLYFPDPWPKKRHHKRRIVQPVFIEKILSRLKPGAYLHMATDWQEYAEHMLTVLSNTPQLHNPHPDFAPRPPWRPLTKFEERGMKLGHGVWDVWFTKLS